MNQSANMLEQEIAALQKTIAVLKERVRDLQNRRQDSFAIFESMAHLQALVDERTEELARAKSEVEQKVTERTRELNQKAEELSRANQLLREMDRMKTHLLQNVSHELKTPLVSIRGYAELLRARYASNLSKDQIEFLEIIIRNADHLNRVIEDLVQVSQLAKGISPFDRSIFDLAELTHEVWQEMTPYAQAHDVKMSWHIPSEPVWLEGDRRQIRQMLLNIVSNSIKFSAGCEKRQVRVFLRVSPRRARLIVEDSGIGIPKNKLHRIFERFYQVDPSATRKFGGMGIGLSLVQEVVENHGGTMLVESEVGQGTRFIVQMDLATLQDAVPKPVPALEQTARIDAFVVEDQPESALFYHTALEEFGLNIASYTSAKAALLAVVDKSPRVIVLDLSMPEMSGLDFIDRLHEFTATGKLPYLPRLILITARSQDEILAMGVANRVDAILYKPFSLDALQRALSNMQSRS